MNNKLGYYIAATIVAGVLVFGVATIVRQGSGTANTPCVSTGTTHTVSIKGDKVTPAETEAIRCDTLVITNQDTATRIIAFGEHNKHVAYDGIEEKKLVKGDSVTVTLDRTGRFHFHDHLQDEVEGYFTVTK